MKTIPIIIIIVFAVSIAMLSIGNEFTELKQIKPTTIFQPYGKVVNQYTYANIRVHINITSLFEEVGQLCYAVKMLKDHTLHTRVFLDHFPMGTLQL